MNATLTLDAPARLRRPGMVWGVAVSVVLHLLLIFGYRLSAPKALPELPPKETMTVWLMQPKPPKPAQPTQPTQPIQQAARRRTEAPSKAVASQPAPAAKAAEPAATADNTAPQPITPPTPATPVTVTASNAPDPLYPQQQQQQQQSQRFDVNAALKTARKVANEKDPARAGTAVAQLDDHPLYPERTASELATKMAGAKRESCLNQPGTLLTPLFWLLDKKDHGCKL